MLSPRSVLVLATVYFFSISLQLIAAPTDYLSYKRTQNLSYSPDPTKILRIWMIDVGQGDGLLIQLPHSDGDDPMDILIDGGSWAKVDQDNTRKFIKNLYGDEAVIEYSFITHHDSDHVKGLMNVLNDPAIAVEKIYHNGLASYHPRKKEDPRKYSAKEFIYSKNNKNSVNRVMGRYDLTTKLIDDEYLIGSLTELKTEFDKGHLHNIYHDLASSIINKKLPKPVVQFQRFNVDSTVPLTDTIELIPLWPVEPMRYKNWGYTINGNSLTFSLKYKNFSMLFTGDHNDESQAAMLEYLESASKIELLEADVLKVPHHGSSHGIEDFFRNDSMNAVIGVASMGEKGFGYSWKHPSTKVVRWMGGAHKVFHTFAEEKYINWHSELPIVRNDYEERSHILIETDGEWFRVVEISPGDEAKAIPIVTKVRAGDGTQWIRAIAKDKKGENNE